MDIKEQKKDLRDKYSLKDLASLRFKQIKRTGKKAWLIPRDGIRKLRSWWQSRKDKMREYASEEVEAKEAQYQNRYDEKIENIRTKREELRDSLNTIEENGLRDNSGMQPYIEVTENKISKLENKEAKIVQAGPKGLGVFALSRLALKKLTKEKIEKAQNRIAAMKEKHQRNKADREARRDDKRRRKEIERLLVKKSVYLDFANRVQEQIRDIDSRLNDLGYDNEVEEDMADEFETEIDPSFNPEPGFGRS